MCGFYNRFGLFFLSTTGIKQSVQPIQDSKSFTCYFTTSLSHLVILAVTISRGGKKENIIETTKHLTLPYCLLSIQLLEAAKSKFCNMAIPKIDHYFFETCQQSQQRSRALEQIIRGVWRIQFLSSLSCKVSPLQTKGRCIHSSGFQSQQNSTFNKLISGNLLALKSLHFHIYILQHLECFYLLLESPDFGHLHQIQSFHKYFTAACLSLLMEQGAICLHSSLQTHQQ